jgi:sugar phosphate isomerase/epimerase
MKLGVCSNFRQAETVKKLGYDYIEEHFYRLSIYTEEEFEEAKKAYKNAGIEIYSTNCFFGPGVNLYSDEVYELLKQITKYSKLFYKLVRKTMLEEQFEKDLELLCNLPDKKDT